MLSPFGNHEITIVNEGIDTYYMVTQMFITNSGPRLHFACAKTLLEAVNIFNRTLPY